MVPNHPGPVPLLFAQVDTVDDVYDTMVLANDDQASPLFERIDIARMGLIGHSLGGAVGLYAVGKQCVPGICTSFPNPDYPSPPALQAAAFYGTNLADSNGGVTDLSTSGVAVALVQGLLDGIAPAQEAESTYPTLETPRALIEIDEANHYAICDSNNPEHATEDPVESPLPQTLANLTVGRWIGLWLRAELLDDPWARLWIERIGGSMDGRVNVSTCRAPDPVDCPPL